MILSAAFVLLASSPAPAPAWNPVLAPAIVVESQEGTGAPEESAVEAEPASRTLGPTLFEELIPGTVLD